MIWGSFLSDRDLPIVQIPISFGQTTLYLSFILDTGFSGDLKIDERTATELGITAPGVGHFINANGQDILSGTAQGYVELESKKAPVTIIIANGAYLAGGALFTLFGYRVVVDYKNREARLERVN
jgi:predicted aspartyl protease